MKNFDITILRMGACGAAMVGFDSDFIFIFDRDTDEVQEIF